MKLFFICFFALFWASNASSKVIHKEFENEFLVNFLKLQAFEADNLTNPVTSYSFVSEKGDYIGMGNSQSFSTPSDVITLTGSASDLTVHVNPNNEYWNIQLAAPRGQRLQPGVYLNAERAPFRTGRAPGLAVDGEHRGCNEVFGRFVIDQIETAPDTSGALTALDGTFEQHCERSASPALRGVVRYRARALGYRFFSDSGDYIGQGLTKAYRGATSTFSISGNVKGHVEVRVSGDRDDWSVEFAAAGGQQLAVGNYSDARRYPFNGKFPGLSISGCGRGCNTLTGSFIVHALEADQDGDVKAFSASFEQHCEGVKAALRGDVNYLAGKFFD